MMSDFIDDQGRLLELRRRGARRIVGPMSLSAGLALRLAEQIRENETLSDSEKLQMFQALPRNRREARRLLRGNGPWGLPRRCG